MELATLYKRAKTGDIQYWKIEVLPSYNGWTIHKESGKLGTKSPIRHAEEITEGKNIGRANETIPKIQAESQAESDWKRKQDEGYKTLEQLGIVDTNPSGDPHRYGSNKIVLTDDLQKILDAHLPQFNTDASGNAKPMLALDHKKVKKIDYPVLVQPKLDGVRCLMVVTADGARNYNLTFLSRSGKPYTTLGHIAQWVLKYLGIAEPVEGFILDGEIYSDELTFQEIIQAVKKQYPNSLKLHFRAYDVVGDSDQVERLVQSRKIVEQINSPFVHEVGTYTVDNYDAVKFLHDKFVQEGYEGAMIRLMSGKYEQGARSRSLLKVKEFDETEFDFLRWEVGQREEDLLAVLWAPAKELPADTFRAKMIGSRAEKELMRQAHPKQITVKHFGWTTDGLPRFPVGKSIRDYD